MDNSPSSVQSIDLGPCFASKNEMICYGVCTSQTTHTHTRTLDEVKLNKLVNAWLVYKSLFFIPDIWESVTKNPSV